MKTTISVGFTDEFHEIFKEKIILNFTTSSRKQKQRDQSSTLL
jgi:hypothetical protein